MNKNLHSIDLPELQVLGGVEGAFFGAETVALSDSYFQTGINDNFPEIGLSFQGVETDREEPEEGTSLYNSSVRVKIPRRGRPQTRPWYERRENGRLRHGRKAITKVIADDMIVAMLDAAEHANVIKAPLNTFVTIRPANIDDVPAKKRSEFWQVELNRISRLLARNGITQVYIWSRESRIPDGTAEHLHLLIHLPKSMVEKLRSCLLDRYPGPGEVDVRPASDVARMAENGKYLSAVTYVCKAMSQRARRKSNQPYRPSGPVMGKRAGMTRNIDAKAVAAYRSALGQATMRAA